MSKIAVSVVMITYNHKDYIRQAIESVLNQTFQFEFELIVADDNSTDNTQDIIKDIILNHKNGYRINYIRQDVNIGMQENFIFALKNVIGEFVALCEGDDFWTDNNKISFQYELMNTQNIDLCFHHGYFVNKKGKIIKDYYLETKDWCFTSFLDGQMPFTSSVMFRSNILKISNLYELLQMSISCDKVILSFSSLNQKVCLMNFYGSAYRQHELGVSKFFNKRNWLSNEIIMHNYLDAYSDYVYHKKFLELNANKYFHMAEYYSINLVDRFNLFLLGVNGYLKGSFSLSRIKHVGFTFLCVFLKYRKKSKTVL